MTDMVMVPREPTDAEIAAVHAALTGPAPAYTGPTNSLARFDLLARHIARAMLAAAPLASECAQDDGWIAWSGGENPVPDAKVQVRFRDGSISTAQGIESDVYVWLWAKTLWAADIIAYRIVPAPPGDKGGA